MGKSLPVKWGLMKSSRLLPYLPILDELERKISEQTLLLILSHCQGRRKSKIVTICIPGKCIYYFERVEGVVSNERFCLHLKSVFAVKKIKIILI
jgi:hypothetical protein